MSRSSQGLVPSLDVSYESKNLFPGAWRHKSRLTVPDKSLSREVEESLSGVTFLLDEIPRLQGETLKALISEDCAMKRLVYLKHG